MFASITNITPSVFHFNDSSQQRPSSTVSRLRPEETRRIGQEVMLELGLAVEDAFHVEIRGRDLNGLKTVADLVNYVQEHGGNR
jgi:hypothetical protein